MHKLSTRLLSLLLSVMLIVGMSFTAYAAEGDKYETYGTETYGSYTFSSLYSGDIYYGELTSTAQKIYDGLKTAMTNPKNSWQAIEIPLNSIDSDDITTETLIKAYSALRNEWPELFYWADLSFSMAVESSKVNWRISYFSSVQAEYQGAKREYLSPSGVVGKPGKIYTYWDINPTTVDKQQKKAEAKAAEVLRNAPKDSDYDKVVYFNNWIVENTAYDYDGIEPGTPYDNTYHITGVFNDGLAVCEGYAKAFKYLCDKSEIECLYVTGGLRMNDNGDLGPHAWNYVKVDGAWYIVDATNNDGNYNIALCIGNDDWFAGNLVPDRVFNIDGKVFIETPSVPLSSENYIQQVTLTLPTKTEHVIGELDLSGGKVTATYHDGTTKTVDMTADMLVAVDLENEKLFDFDMDKVGTQKVTVIYNGTVANVPFDITLNNAPEKATIHEAVVNYPLGISGLDLSKGYAMVTYKDKTVERPNLNETEKVKVTTNMPIGVSGVTEAGKYTVEVTILDANKPLTVSYEIGVGLDTPLPELPAEGEEPGGGDHGGSGSTGGSSSRGGSTSKVPGALAPDKAITALTNLDPKSPPAASKTVTVGGKNIVTVPMSITDSGLLGVDIITKLGALPSGVGVIINQGSGLPDLLIPSGFKFTPEAGQFALNLKITNELAADAKSVVTKALETSKRTMVYVGTLGGTTVTKFPVPFTVMIPVKLAEGTTVTVQMVDPVTGKQLSSVTAKVVGGIVSFSTGTTGGMVVSINK